MGPRPLIPLLLAIGAGCRATAPGVPPEVPMAATPRLYRVILPVTDLERAQTFYEELLGVAGRRVAPGRHYLDAGPVVVALYDPGGDGDAIEARPNQEPVYFAVEDLETFHRRAVGVGARPWRDREVDADQSFEIQERPWGERSFYVVDPFGNPLCFVDERTVFTGR